MAPVTTARVLVQADDFSGAAEVGQQFAAHGLTARIALTTTAAPHRRDSLAEGAEVVVVVDTHSRGMSSTAASETVKAAVTEAGLGTGTLVFKKTDSLWRGNVGAELSALTELGYHVVLAGALPAMERTVVGARPLAGGLPLRASDLWRVESALPPEDLAELFTATADRTAGAIRFLGLGDVRSPDLAARLNGALRAQAPTILVADGETNGDLAAIVDALAALEFTAEGRPTALAGTGQLAGLLASRLAQQRAQEPAQKPAHEPLHVPAQEPLPGPAQVPVGASPHEPAHTAQSPADVAPSTRPARRRGPVLAIVGSASPAARRQVGHLAAEGFAVVGLRPHADGPDGERSAASRIRTALAQGHPVALTVGDSPVDPARSASIVAQLARLAREGQQGLRPDLILTGGETAREVLDALGVTALVPRTAVQHGAVVSATDDGRLVATKPGSFGDPLVLVQLYRSIQSHASTPRAGLLAH